MSEPITVDAPRAVELRAEAVTQRGGDFVYEHHNDGGTIACYYVWRGQPDCIAGNALHRAGVSIDALSTIEGCTITTLRAGPDAGVLGGVRFSKAAIGVLYAAQDAQDQGLSWGEALKQAQKAAIYAAEVAR